MTINVNNKLQSITENSSILTLLEELNILSNGIAVAVNNQIISKDSWNNTFLLPEDQVTIIQATQGG